MPDSGVRLEHKIKKLETGISGLDAVLNGGIPYKNQVLIAGGPGTGKTLMAFEILYRAAKRGIPCAFITLDEKSEDMLRNIRSTFMGMEEIDALMKKNLLTVGGEDSAAKVSTNTESESNYSMGNIISDIEAMIKYNDAQIVAIDSLSFMKLMLGKSILYNKVVSALISNMRRLDITAIFTSDIPYYSRKKIKFSQEILLFDGFMALYHMVAEEKEKLAVEIIKMRGSDHARKLSNYEITSDGIMLK